MREVFEAIYEVYGDWVIALKYPKFARKVPSLFFKFKPAQLFSWRYIEDNCYFENLKAKEELIGAIKKLLLLLVILITISACKSSCDIKDTFIY